MADLKGSALQLLCVIILNPQAVQSTTFRFFIRLNSLTLFVTRVTPILRACAPINVSREPIGLPVFSSCERVIPYVSAAFSSKGAVSRGRTNSSRAILFCFLCWLLATLYWSSARVIEEIPTSPAVCFLDFL